MQRPSMQSRTLIRRFRQIGRWQSQDLLSDFMLTHRGGNSIWMVLRRPETSAAVTSSARSSSSVRMYPRTKSRRARYAGASLEVGQTPIEGLSLSMPIITESTVRLHLISLVCSRFIAAEWDITGVVPSNVSPQQAASIPIPFVTAVSPQFTHTLRSV